MRNPLPSYERLHEVFSYEEDTGLLRYKCSPARRNKIGSIAGYVCADTGHVNVQLDGMRYKAHSLIWKMKTGRAPFPEIDHADLDGANNRWINLREATGSQNNANKKNRVDNLSGFKGVSWSEKSQKWRAQICKDGKVTHLGFFNAPDQAHEVYKAKARELFGEFARAA